MTHKSRLEFFEKGYAQWGLEVGVISTSTFAKFIHWKVFQDFISHGHDKSTAIQMTADRTRASFSTVWRSVQYFSS